MPVVIFSEELTKKSFLDEFTLPKYLLPNKDDFNKIWDLHPENRSEIMIHGSKIQIPRFQKSYIKDYAFSGAVAKAAPLPKILQPYLDFCNSLKYGVFNQFLLNWYENGNNYIGSHADDEKQLVPNSPIVTITLSDKNTHRTFRIRDKKDKSIVKDVETTNGMVLVMGGHFQKEFKHEIVKINGKKGEETGRRISITLRQFK